MNKFHNLLLQIKKNKFSLIVWLLYTSCLIFISYNHELWHDEGQAWLIARDDSLWQLLTVTTHYEGHPPLWHLCLMPFAKAGVPFLLGIKTVNVLFASLAMGVLIFKSPFPWYLRLTLPFTYFFFYQYGVFDRVYSLLMLAMMLIAYYYSQRREQPYKLALSLALAAGSQAYGMMFACGVAIVWLGENIKREKISFRNFFSVTRKSGELRGLGLLFVISLFFVICIWPFNDTEFTGNGAKTGFWENMFYLFTVMPGQILASNSMQSNISENSLQFFLMNYYNYKKLILQQGFYGVPLAIHWLISYFYGAFFNAGIIYVCKKGGIIFLFLCPFLLMNLLGSLVYWNIYHSGVWACLYVFVLWQIWSDKNRMSEIELAIRRIFTYDKEYFFVKRGLVICLLGVLLTNFSWTWNASKNNVLYDADASGAIADFIKKNNLTEYDIWLAAKYKDINKISNAITGDLAINCFFKKNIFQNLDGGRTNHAYHDYKLLSKETYISNVREFGQPDFVLGEDEHLDYVFPQHANYVPIKEFFGYFIWKDSVKKGSTCMYAREDMLQKLPWLHRIPGKANMGTK